MTPEEQLRELREPDRWTNVRLPRPAEHRVPPRYRISRRGVPSAAAFAIAVATVAAIYFALTAVHPASTPAGQNSSPVIGFTCPTSAQAPPHSSLKEAGAALLPFTPDGAVACRYGGLNSADPTQLVRSANVTTTNELTKLTQLVSAASQHRYGTGAYNCPADFNTHTNLYFHDPATKSWSEISIATSGCATVSNGTITNAEFSTELSTAVNSLVGTPGR